MTDAAALPDRPGLMPIVEWVISHGRNGPVASHDVDGTAGAVAGALAVPERFGFLRRACLPAWLELMSDTAGKPTSEPAEELVHA